MLSVRFSGPLPNICFEWTELHRFLERNLNLQCLEFFKKNLYYGDVKALLDGISCNVVLQELDLSCNTFVDPKSKDLIAKVLRSNKTLKIVSLRKAKLGDQAIRKLAEALLDNTSLTSLDIGDNEMKESATIAIGNLLSWNKTLKELNLQNNPIKPSEAIRQGLMNNASLHNIGIPQMKIGDQGKVK